MMNYKRRSSRDSATDRIVVVEQQHLHGSSTGESINTGVSSNTGRDLRIVFRSNRISNRIGRKISHKA